MVTLTRFCTIIARRHMDNNSIRRRLQRTMTRRMDLTTRTLLFQHTQANSSFSAFITVSLLELSLTSMNRGFNSRHLRINRNNFYIFMFQRFRLNRAQQGTFNRVSNSLCLTGRQRRIQMRAHLRRHVQISIFHNNINFDLIRRVTRNIRRLLRGQSKDNMRKGDRNDLIL